MNRRYYNLAIVSAFVAFLVQFTNTALAESVTFQREYTYQASEDDSKLSSRAKALAQVKRLLLEELGTYLEAQTEVKNYKLTKDQITTLTSGIVQTKIVSEKWDGKKYWLKAKITADPKRVAKSLDAMSKDRQKSRELGNDLGSEEVNQGIAKLHLVKSRGFFIDNKQAGQLFVIHGRIRNDFPAPRSWILLRAKIFTTHGQTARQLDFYAGTMLSDKQLRSLPLEELVGLIQRPPIKQDRVQPIAAREEVTFMVPFGDLPELTKLSDYSVELLKSEPSISIEEWTLRNEGLLEAP